MEMREIIGKRKMIWKRDHNLEQDKALTRAIAVKILEDDHLKEEVLKRPYLLIEAVMYVVDKDKKSIPFFLNEVQIDFIRKLQENGTGKPYFILKGRQQGFTTLITAMQLCYAIVMPNFSGFTVSNSPSNTEAIFNDKAKVPYERLPQELKPHEKFNNKTEYFFDKLNSTWRCATATSQMGRSRTLNFCHFSEVAFFNCPLSDIQSSIGEALTRDAIVVYETTANGFNDAKNLWDSGSCNNLFYGWWRSKEYREEDLTWMVKPLSSKATNVEWLKERIKFLKNTLGLDNQQIAWYCKKYDSYLDKRLMRQEYPCSPEEAFIASGDCVFDMDKLTEQISNAQEPIKRGYFLYKKTPVILEGNEVRYQMTDIEWNESPSGAISIFKEPLSKVENATEYKCPYAIGADTAGEGLDFYAARVINVLSGQAVATFHINNMDEDLFAEQMYCLGKYYNDAMIGIEVNYSAYPTRVLARELEYPSLYTRERLDAMSDKPIKEYGFQTNKSSKEMIINDLIKIMRERPESEIDKRVLLEMTTFVRKPNGSKEAVEGCHDDLVMSTAIAHYVATKVSPEWKVGKNEEIEFFKKNFSGKDIDSFVGDSSDYEEYMSWDY